MGEAEKPWEGRFQILSLDGGGIKGMFSAPLLTKFEDDLGINVVDHFDLITGTSTGGIIALGLGFGLKPREILRFYIDAGQTIFRNPLGWRSLLQIARSKFSSRALTAALQEVFQDRLLGSSTKRLVIPSYTLGEDDVYLFKTPHHP